MTTGFQVVYERPPRKGERACWHVVDAIPASTLDEALIWAEAFGAKDLSSVGRETLTDGRRVTVSEAVPASRQAAR